MLSKENSRLTKDGGHLDDVQSLAHGVVLGGQIGPVHPAYVVLAHAHQPQSRSLLESGSFEGKNETHDRKDRCKLRKNTRVRKEKEKRKSK